MLVYFINWVWEQTTEPPTCCLGRRVSECSLLAQCADTDTSHRGGDQHPTWVLNRPPLLQQRSELSDGVEHTLDVQIHHLGESGVRVLVERLAPCCAGVGEEDVDVVGVLLDLLKEALDALDGGGIGGDGDGFRAGLEVGEGVELRNGFFAGFGFAGSDEDFRGAGLEEAEMMSVRIT